MMELMLSIGVVRVVTNLFASTSLFEFGKKLAVGAGTVGVISFLVLAVGNHLGRTPTRGQALGRVQAARHISWIGLCLAIVGLVLMAVGS
jgi:uncharacterized membrane protein